MKLYRYFYFGCAIAWVVIAINAVAGTGRIHPPARPATATAPAPAAIPAPPPVVGVWYQPASSHATWRARGVTTLLGYEDEGGATSPAAWCKSANASGLHYFLQHSPATDPHILDANCDGWLLGDEPNGAGALSPAQTKAAADACRAVANMPVLLNLDGWKLQYESDAEIAAYSLAGDIIAFDYYIINRGEDPAGIAKLGAITDRLKRLAPGKPIICFIECSDQNLRVQSWANDPDASGTPPGPRMRCPTAAEMTLEIATVQAHGAAGIAYFPDIIGTNFEAFDGTPTALVAAMMTEAAKTTLPPASIPASQPTSQPTGLPEVLMINGAAYKRQ